MYANIYLTIVVMVYNQDSLAGVNISTPPERSLKGITSFLSHNSSYFTSQGRGSSLYSNQGSQSMQLGGHNQFQFFSKTHRSHNKEEGSNAGSSGKIGSRMMKRLVEREFEEKGEAAGLSMEAILRASSSLSESESGEKKMKNVLTMEERTFGTTVPVEPTPEHSDYNDDDRSNDKKSLLEGASTGEHKKKGDSIYDEGSQASLGSRLFRWMSGTSTSKDSPYGTGKSDAFQPSASKSFSIGSQSTINTAMREKKKKAAANNNEFTKGQALFSHERKRKFSTPSPLDLGFAPPHVIPVMEEESLSPHWKEWDAPAAIQPPREEEEGSDIEDDEEQRVSYSNAVVSERIKNLRKKKTELFGKLAKSKMKIKTNRSALAQREETEDSSNKKDASSTNQSSFHFNTEGRLVKNKILHEAPPTWISQNTDQVLGIVHLPSKLADDSSYAPEVETPISAFPPPPASSSSRVFGLLATDNNDDEDLSQIIQRRSKSHKNRRGISSDPPSVISVDFSRESSRVDPPPSRSSSRGRTKFEYRKPVMQVAVGNDNNSVILGSVDKGSEGHMELEWGHAI